MSDVNGLRPGNGISGAAVPDAGGLEQEFTDVVATQPADIEPPVAAEQRAQPPISTSARDLAPPSPQPVVATAQTPETAAPPKPATSVRADVFVYDGANNDGTAAQVTLSPAAPISLGENVTGTGAVYYRANNGTTPTGAAIDTDVIGASGGISIKTGGPTLTVNGVVESTSGTIGNTPVSSTFAGVTVGANQQVAAWDGGSLSARAEIGLSHFQNNITSVSSDQLRPAASVTATQRLGDVSLTASGSVQERIPLDANSARLTVVSAAVGASVPLGANGTAGIEYRHVFEGAPSSADFGAGNAGEGGTIRATVGLKF